jgi:hypothetical protein
MADAIEDIIGDYRAFADRRCTTPDGRRVYRQLREIRADFTASMFTAMGFNTP